MFIREDCHLRRVLGKTMKRNALHKNKHDYIQSYKHGLQTHLKH